MPKDNDKSRRISSLRFLLLAVVGLVCIYGVYSAWQSDQVPAVVSPPPPSNFSERNDAPSSGNKQQNQTEVAPQSQTGNHTGDGVATSKGNNQRIDRDENTRVPNNRISKPNGTVSGPNSSTKSSSQQSVGNPLSGNATIHDKHQNGAPTWMMALVIASLAISLVSLGFVLILWRAQPKVIDQPSVFDAVMKKTEAQLSFDRQSLLNHVESRLSEITNNLLAHVSRLTAEGNELSSRVQIVQSQVSKVSFDVANQSRRLENYELKALPAHITNVTSSADSIVGDVESVTELSTSEQEVLNRIVTEVNRPDVVYGSVRSGTRDWDYFSEALKSRIRSELNKLDVEVIEPAIGESIDLARMDFDSAPLGHRSKVKEVVMLGLIIRSTGAIAKAKVIVE